MNIKLFYNIGKKSSIIIRMTIILILLLSYICSYKTIALKIENYNFDEINSLKLSNNEIFEGYTLFAPEYSKKTYLINNEGKVVHKWKSNHAQALQVYLLENGNLLRADAPGFDLRFIRGGFSGRIEMFNWDGDLLWEFEYITKDHYIHHGFKVLPNGNILLIAALDKTRAEAVAAGCDPNLLRLKLGMDYIIEIQPTPPQGANIVWEWYIWDHIIQDFDSTKDNYGVIAEHPELIDINYRSFSEPLFKFFMFTIDFAHMNSLDYNEEFDQILISSRFLNEIWIIDHSTTTAEAAGHSGGRYGKGGDLLYRWGNPQVYKAGNSSTQVFFGQHDARWIEEGYPGEGHITVFNNGWKRPDKKFSSIYEIIPPVDSNGNYYLEPGYSYGPEEPIWLYVAENPTDFFSGALSSAQRLPNGNTLVCEGEPGNFFELNPEKKIIWSYKNLFPFPLPSTEFNSVPTVDKYPKNYSGIGNLLIDMDTKITDLKNIKHIINYFLWW